MPLMVPQDTAAARRLPPAHPAGMIAPMFSFTRRRIGPLIAAAVVLAALPRGTARAQGYAPDEAPKKMTVANGFAVSLVAAEPAVRQPVAIEFDDRGRLWVVQYLQ